MTSRQVKPVRMPVGKLGVSVPDLSANDLLYRCAVGSTVGMTSVSLLMRC